MRIRLQHTRYPHIGARAGYIQFVRHLDPARLEVEIDAAADSDADLPLLPGPLRHPLRRLVQRRGMPWYKLSDLAAEVRAWRACAAGRHDLVHFLDGEHALQYLPVWLGAIGSQTRIVATYHQPPSLLAQLVRADVVARLDRVTVVAPAQIDFFRELVPENRIEVIPHGVDTGFFRPPARRDTDGPLRCVTVGRWLRDWDALRATARALSSEPIRFDIVSGDDTGFESCPNVVLHRTLDDEALADLYRASDVLLLPLLDATANNTLLEGMASGLPVVSSDLSGVRAYLPDDAGLLVRGNDVRGFVEALRRLRVDPAQRLALGRAARQRAEELAWPNVADHLARFYERVAAGTAPACRAAETSVPVPDETPISVVIPAHNAARTLPRTLASALAQTHRTLEVLVVDDGSTDSTAEVAAEVCRIDRRVRLLRQANAGVAAARNRGIEAARGDFIAPLDADDLWHPEKLAKQVARFRASGPDTALVSCWKCKIDGDDRLIRAHPPAGERDWPTFQSLLRANTICASAPLLRSAVLRDAGGYDPTLRQRGGEGTEDLKLYLDLAHRYRFEMVPEVLVAYRVTPTSMSHRIEQMRRAHHLVLDDIEARHREVPRAWFDRGRCRADLDAIVRLTTASRYREALSLAMSLGRRYPTALLREVSSRHGLRFPLRLLERTRRLSKRDLLDWPIGGVPQVVQEQRTAGMEDRDAEAAPT